LTVAAAAPAPGSLLDGRPTAGAAAAVVAVAVADAAAAAAVVAAAPAAAAAALACWEATQQQVVAVLLPSLLLVWLLLLLLLLPMLWSQFAASWTAFAVVADVAGLTLADLQPQRWKLQQDTAPCFLSHLMCGRWNCWK
jgi:hypothetical protein